MYFSKSSAGEVWSKRFNATVTNSEPDAKMASFIVGSEPNLPVPTKSLELNVLPAMVSCF